MKNASGGIVAIFWGPHSRHMEDLAVHIGAEPYAIDVMSFTWRKYSFLAPIKYVLQALVTWAVLIARRPSLVYVIITPTFSALAVYLYCLVARIPYVMDVHGHSLTSRKWAWTVPLQKFLAKRALATLVDQRLYQETFEGAGARTVVLERSPVNINVSALKRLPATEPFSVTMVSIFAVDEPVDIVVEAARLVPDVRFYITGDTKRAPAALLSSAPPNVTFTGYLYSDEYLNRLYSSNAVMTLTTEAYSLVSGGVESMALGLPTILSRQPVLLDYFTKGAVFVEHTPESIAAGVKQARDAEERLRREISTLAAEKIDRWQSAMKDLRGRIAKVTGRQVSPPHMEMAETPTSGGKR
jgi:glycosyltransferase involved in cell wall biosynthesis